MQLEKNKLICGETVVHQIWEKKWKISYMWEFLIFFFTYVPYTINYPLLYSLTSIIPLKCMEFHFSLSVTITDFFSAQTQHTDAFSHSEKSPQS